MKKTFDPKEQPDLYWARQTIENTVELYNYNILSDNFTEDDIEYRIWFFVAKSFLPTDIRASSKKKSLASAERHNQNRTLAVTESVARKATGCQPDMKCVYLNYEIALSEVGLADDGENGTKELHESGLKAPKMLKDFFCIFNKYISIKRP
ncbi:hypothetical protein BDC45DRAFT_171484 [Circinella umbellata]|nr:hypothetical protein BDC45DRAFT_171484 [Circinella umbellata]